MTEFLLNGIVVTLLLVLVLILCYSLYQIVRNEAIFRIRLKWIAEEDYKWHKYSYDYMFDPNKSNWFGLKYPNINDYKS